MQFDLTVLFYCIKQYFRVNLIQIKIVSSFGDFFLVSLPQILSIYIHFYDLQLFRKETYAGSCTPILSINVSLLQLEMFLGGIVILL